MPPPENSPDLQPTSDDPTTSSSWRADALAALLLILAPLVLLGPAIWSDAQFVPLELAQYPPWSLHETEEDRLQRDSYPINSDVTETQVVFAPEFALAAAESREGRFPAWNPYARHGAPLFAPGLTALYQPFNALLLWTDTPEAGLAMKAWTSLLVAGLLTYLLLRELRLRPLASLFGALAFAYGGTVIANLHFYNRVDAMVWMPGMLLACHRAVDRRGWRRIPEVCLLAVTTATTWLSGFLPFAVPVTLAVGAWSGLLVVSRARTHGIRDGLALSLALLAGAVLGVTAVLFQLLPALLFFPESNRDLAPDLLALASNGFDPAALIGLTMPRAWVDCFGSLPTPQRNPLLLLWTGRLAWESGEVLYPPNHNYTETTLYPGLAALVCLPFALLRPRSIDGRAAARRRLPILVLLCGFAALMLGTVWTSMLQQLPLMRNIQPMRFIAPVSLFLAIGGAFGLERLLASARSSSTDRWPLVAVALAGLAALLHTVLYASGGAVGPDSEILYQQLLERYATHMPSGVTPDAIESFLGSVPTASVPGADSRTDPLPALDAARARLKHAAGHAALAWTLLTIALIGLVPMVHRLLGASKGAGLARASGVVLTLFAASDLYVQGVDVAATRVPLDRSPTSTHAFLASAERDAAPEGGIAVLRVAPQGTPPGLEAGQLPVCTLFPARIRDLNTYDWVDRWSSDVFRLLYEPDYLIRNTWPRALPDDERLDLPVFDALGASHTLTHFPADGAARGLADATRHAGAVAHEEVGVNGRLVVHARSSVLPRAWCVPGIEVLADDRAVAERMVTAGFAPRASALMVPAERAVLGDAARLVDGATPMQRGVRFVRDDVTRLELAVEPGDAPALLVLRDAALSGWRATVDGADAPIARGHGWMRVVAIPAGACTVVFSYTTPGLVLGSTVSATAWLILLVGFAVSLWKCRSGR